MRKIGVRSRQKARPDPVGSLFEEKLRNSLAIKGF